MSKSFERMLLTKVFSTVFCVVKWEIVSYRED